MEKELVELNNTIEEADMRFRRMLDDLKWVQRMDNDIQQKLDYAVTDIEHDIELSSMNAGELAHEMKVFRMVLRMRRKYKNLYHALKVCKSSVGRTMFSQLNGIDGKRMYEPRVLTELKICKTSQKNSEELKEEQKLA